jgi:hypothetical protein
LKSALDDDFQKYSRHWHALYFLCQ